MGKITARLAKSLGWPSAEKGRLTGESQVAPSSLLRSWSLQQQGSSELIFLAPLQTKVAEGAGRRQLSFLRPVLALLLAC